ncbi:MAG: DUF3459 domain-containing protein, partial [Betaproteobacteria bacterium]
AVARTGEGRAVNRHNYTNAEIEEALNRPIVRRLLQLIRLRNTHPAFDGLLRVDTDGGSRLQMFWQGESSSCQLDVDLGTGATSITESSEMPLVAET